MARYLVVPFGPGQGRQSCGVARRIRARLGCGAPARQLGAQVRRPTQREDQPPGAGIQGGVESGRPGRLETPLDRKDKLFGFSGALYQDHRLTLHVECDYRSMTGVGSRLVASCGQCCSPVRP
jgi:hypothetical protein